MDETFLLPSPNWFQVSGLAVARDGWLAYGGPSKSLCVLQPVPSVAGGLLEGTQQYTAHVLNRAHTDKIVSVDISPNWPCERVLLTGSASGSVKQWRLERQHYKMVLKTTHSHNVHNHGKEAVVSVGYSTSSKAVTVGSFANIIKWDLTANVVKSYNSLLKSFRPTCMAVSRHLELIAAIGTKQGVLFVVDLTDAGEILYKVRGHDEEIMNLSWCTDYEVCIEKLLDEPKKADASTSEDKDIPKPKKVSASDRLEKIRQQAEPEEKNTSGVAKKLPEDSFEDFEVVPEDDTFDIYKDHEADEFGHKKYTPEDIYVKVKEPEKELDYLAECSKLKEDILKNKSEPKSRMQELLEKYVIEPRRRPEPEPTIESLVDKFNRAEINSDSGSYDMPSCSSKPSCSVDTSVSYVKIESADLDDGDEDHDQSAASEKSISSKHIHRHLLASIGKYGSIRIWSKSGKQVASGTIQGGRNQYGKAKQTAWATLTWCKPDLMLIGDGKNQLLQCNPLKLNSKNKLETKVVHSLHKRALHCVAYNAGEAWSVSQDRYLVRHTLEDGKSTMYHTCGGFVYNIHACPYDSMKMAVSVGDGAVRVWTAEASDESDYKLRAGSVVTYWQQVQGKVLTVAWHPFKENMLAFGTAESRVGIIDTSSADKPARALQVGLNGGVYSLCWSNTRLYAVARGELVAYSMENLDAPPTPIPVTFEGAKWGVTAVRTRGSLLYLGSQIGGLCVVTDDGLNILAAAFPFSKIIHTIELHPEQTSLSDKQSPNKNMLAICSQDKFNSIIIMRFVDREDGSKKLTHTKTLCGHSDTVLQLAWSPHEDGRLLTTSHDGCVQMWDVDMGSCLAAFSGHGTSSLSACWAAQPAAAAYVLSGGSDCCLRVWNIDDFPAGKLGSVEFVKKSRKKKKDTTKESANEEPIKITDDQFELAMASVNQSNKPGAQKNYLAPFITKEMSKHQIRGIRRLFERYCLKKYRMESKLRRNGEEKPLEEENCNGEEKLVEKVNGNDEEKPVQEEKNVEQGGSGDVDIDDKKDVEKNSDENAQESEEVEDFELEYVKIFGTMNELNGVFELEMSRHMEFGNVEQWIVLCMFRGHVDAMIKFASERNIICPFLLSLAPSVSSKYWKDVSRLYLAQIDRLVADGESDKLTVNRNYGGPVFRKTMILLSLQDVKGAVNTLCEAKLFKEAYLLCRIRYIDTIAEEVLHAWAKHCMQCGQAEMAAMCYIVLGDLLEAATVLGKSNDQELLSLAADLAKVAGQATLSQSLLDRKANIKDKTPVPSAENTTEVLEDLPTRGELLVKETNDEEKKMDVSNTEESIEENTELSVDLPTREELIVKGNGVEENNMNVSNMEHINTKESNGESDMNEHNGINEICNGISKENGHCDVVNGHAKVNGNVNGN